MRLDDPVMDKKDTETYSQRTSVFVVFCVDDECERGYGFWS